jgi:hypothetical protein
MRASEANNRLRSCTSYQSSWRQTDRNGLARRSNRRPYRRNKLIHQMSDPERHDDGKLKAYLVLSRDQKVLPCGSKWEGNVVGVWL